MIASIINASITHRAMVLLAGLVLTIAGLLNLQTMPVDALPDLSDVQVIIRTPFAGQAPQVVEDQVTYPLTTAMLSVPGAVNVRGYSFFGDSYVYILFADGTDPYWARSRVLEYLSQVSAALPASVSPALGPDATGVGWVYEYALVDRTGQHDLSQLRALQDWFLKYELQTVPGVSEVASIGGMVKQYQVIVDPDKLNAYQLTLAQVRTAIKRGNREVGGSVIEMAETEFMIRATGYLKSLDDLRKIPLSSNAQGTAVLLADVAHVQIGPQLRRGIAELNGEGEVAGGVVVMRFGENAQTTIEAVKQRIMEISNSLPEGVEIVPTYDRSELINNAVKNLNTKLIEEFIVVAIICALFLFHIRSSLVAIATLPLGILAALLIMRAQGLNANIMSLGGIAIAIGALSKPTHIPMDTGLLITNPPYGERLGDQDSLIDLYHKLGTKLKEEFAGWQAGIFTGNVELGKKVGLHSHKQYQLYNGAIPSKLLMFDIKPDNFINVRPERLEKTSISNEEKPLSDGAQMFANRLRKNKKNISKWVKNNHIHAYRLYDADMPEYNVAIDCYNDWIHVAEYVPPAKVSSEGAEQRLAEVMSAIPEALDIDPEKIVLKQRRRQKGDQQYERNKQSNEFFNVHEGQATLQVNLKDYLDTGLFLDHRPIRLNIAEMAKGKRFLNLFCYTGAVSVHAALGGATHTDSVDMSRTYLEWAGKNMALNGFNGANHQQIRADARQWLKDADQHYDLIFLDPPTFSNSKKMEGVLDIQRDHVELINDAMDRLIPGGLLIFSTNQRRFKLDKNALSDFILEDKTKWSIDKDFSRSNHIHQCWFIRY